jgi:hypothetical protein
MIGAIAAVIGGTVVFGSNPAQNRNNRNNIRKFYFRIRSTFRMPGVSLTGYAAAGSVSPRGRPPFFNRRREAVTR